MELSRGREGGVHDLVGNPVPGEIEEAHVLARVADLARHRLQTAGRALEGGGEVDHRNGAGRLLHALHSHGLEDAHDAFSSRLRSSSASTRKRVAEASAAVSPGYSRVKISRISSTGTSADEPWSAMYSMWRRPATS